MITILVTYAGSETKELEELETGHVNPEAKGRERDCALAEQSFPQPVKAALNSEQHGRQGFRGAARLWTVTVMASPR